jgi:tRNA threonylcarbamoyladenosine biosynthesis protein TsaB
VVTKSFSALAVDTSTDTCSLALCRGGQRWESEHGGLADRSRGIYRWIDELLGPACTTLAELDAIAYGAGPGAFTGLRVATSVAQGLGRAAGLPVCAVSSLESLALGAARARQYTGTVAACLDARMGQVYLGVYEVSAHGSRALAPDALLSPGAVSLPAGALLTAGPGWRAYPELGRLVTAESETGTGDERPSAPAMLEIAARHFARGECVDAARAAPNYLRDRVTG